MYERFSKYFVLLFVLLIGIVIGLITKKLSAALTFAPFIAASLGLIVLSIYMKYKDIQFRKYGVPVKLKIMDVKKIKNKTKRGEEFEDGYETTFEFEYNGEIKVETLQTSKKWKTGTIKNGTYLNKGKRNNLSVGGEGFYSDNGGVIFYFVFGIIILFSCLFGMYKLY